VLSDSEGIGSAVPPTSSLKYLGRLSWPAGGDLPLALCGVTSSPFFSSRFASLTPRLLSPDITVFVVWEELDREIKKFIIRQPPTGEKDDYDSEKSWISDGLPSNNRRRRRGGGRWEVREWREK